MQTPNNPNVNIPDWVNNLVQTWLQEIGNLQRSIINKENAIARLEEHLSENTVPASLKINVVVKVTEERQENMDNIMRAAKETFHTTILHALKDIRSEELKKLKEDAAAKVNQWRQEMHTTIVQMQQEKIIDDSEQPVALAIVYFDSFKKLRTEQEKRFRTADFHNRKKALKRKEEKLQKQQEQALHTTLTDPAIDTLQKQVTNLTAQVKKLKNQTAMSDGRRNNFTGSGQSKKTQGKNQTQTSAKKGRTKKIILHKENNSELGSGSGSGNRKHPSRSKHTTGQSGSNQKGSRPKQN